MTNQTKRTHWEAFTRRDRINKCMSALRAARESGHPGDEYSVNEIVYVVQRDYRIARLVKTDEAAITANGALRGPAAHRATEAVQGHDA